MLENVFGDGPKAIKIKDLSEEAKNVIEETKLVLLLKDDQRGLKRLPGFVRDAQEEVAEALSEGYDEEFITSLKGSTKARFNLLGISDSLSEKLTDAIYQS